MAKARALLQLELEAYEASALLAFLQASDDLFEDPDFPGGSELQGIADEVERVIPEMSYTPPVEAADQ
jgi:hypothetical protein